ncbi:MAG: hypothetical protein AAF960_19245 [Bacteroidota bacterium]
MSKLSNGSEQEIICYIDDIVAHKKENLYPQLCDFLHDNRSNKILDKAGLAIHTLNYERGLPCLVATILNSKTVNHRSTLIFCCSAFDCSEHLDDFVEVLRLSNYHAALEASMIIKENCKISNNLLRGKIEHIKTIYDGQSEDKKEILDDLIRFFENQIQV